MQFSCWIDINLNNNETRQWSIKEKINSFTGFNKIRTTLKLLGACPFAEFYMNMNTIITFTMVVGLCAAVPQYYIPSGFLYQHPANVLNSAVEDTLPNELRNDFYKNPLIAARLAKESWLLNKETQVKSCPLILTFLL